MSKFTNLALVLSLAACEQAAPAQNPPVFPAPEAKAAEPAPAPAPTPAPAPAPEPAPEPVVEAAPAKPAVAPVKPKIVRKPVPVSPAPKSGDPPAKIWVGGKGCRPGSRMACRWREEDDERVLPRVTQKPAPQDSAEQP